MLDIERAVGCWIFEMQVLPERIIRGAWWPQINLLSGQAEVLNA